MVLVVREGILGGVSLIVTLLLNFEEKFPSDMSFIS